MKSLKNSIELFIVCELFQFSITQLLTKKIQQASFLGVEFHQSRHYKYHILPQTICQILKVSKPEHCLIFL
jgi:hypothetical protein